MNDSIPVSSALDEETARAEVYGLLAALYYAPPTPELMAQLRVAVTEAPTAGGFLEEPWREVVAAARAVSDAAVAAEFDALFGGVGKPEIYLFGSHYLSGFLNEKPLAALRTDLAALGLGRDDTMSETEDHFAYLCEVMRYLIAGEDVEVANLSQQQKFFTVHMQPWVSAMCDTVAAHPKARFYAALAGFTRAFLAVETQGFDMLG
ncbi:MAG: molecular chaperone TorD family protein [Hydrogenophaga sp.]|uniref:TorD/DmsD family molecular chaperone n=1 Tax=Hydrogenophaga sp. TaxID=1904254 RepID=UPI002717A1C5|nr:molecular chaperone TorD family protein [Hydrogenophaga sp.]MDO9571660.1 molecular chaperone TorD family protein [Hydrogenophaga sp.]MDP3374562.1 molecular chaperone TorD family protein [Hydrogenophaga sp.]